MEPLLTVANLSIAFPGPTESLAAVRNVNLDIPASSITCIVGESGCGKSLTCRAILRLLPEYATLSGSIVFQRKNLLAMPLRELRKIRGARIGMIFQEPMTALNPVLTVGAQTAEPLRLHLGLSRNEAREKVIQFFRQVGIPAPERRFDDYPHQLSGGMRQRVMIAMALSCGPDVLIADEPTTALDATIQGQILRLVRHESEERGMSVLLVTHDLGVVAEIGDNVGVMYAGLLVEKATVRDLFSNPLHPYTQGLIAAHPGRNSIHLHRLCAIPGTVPTLENIPHGCPFQPRCNRAMPVCATERAPVICAGAHSVACWLYSQAS